MRYTVTINFINSVCAFSGARRLEGQLLEAQAEKDTMERRLQLMERQFAEADSEVVHLRNELRRAQASVLNSTSQLPSTSSSSSSSASSSQFSNTESSALAISADISKQCLLLSHFSLPVLMSLGDSNLAEVIANSDAALVRLRAAREEVTRRQVESTDAAGDAAVASGLCCICQENPKSVLLLPCRHLCVCEECCGLNLELTSRLHWPVLEKCPVCRSSISQKMKVFS